MINLKEPTFEELKEKLTTTEQECTKTEKIEQHNTQ